MKNTRFKYFLITVLVMLLGLMSRKFDSYLPNIVAPYIGDTLWAMMVYFGFRFVNPNAKKRNTLIAAFIFSFGIEISQLYHSAWIDNIRGTTIGGLVLGYGFLWSDLICYSIGIVLGFLAELRFEV